MTQPAVLAIDIDDTLADTARHTFQLAKQTFTHPMTVEELLFEYAQPDRVPEWQNPEMYAWFEKHLGNTQYLAEMPVIAEAQQVLPRLQTVMPIACYITSRQHYMKEMTQQWLASNHFPTAPLITRAAEVKEKDWKLTHLKQTINGPVYLIDDNLGKMSQDMVEDFPGMLLWYNPSGAKATNTVVKSCSSWLELEEVIKKHPW